MAEFDFKLEYLPGKCNWVADALSRLTNNVDFVARESLDLSVGVLDDFVFTSD